MRSSSEGPPRSAALTIEGSGKHASETRRQLFRFSRLALPYDDDAPTLGRKLITVIVIASDVSFELRPPIIWPRLRLLCKRTAGVLMPEASIHENDCAMPWKHDVRCPR